MTSPRSHTLVVGGTGMLREASQALARESEVLSSIARSEASLSALGDALAGGACRHLAFALDYRETNLLRAVVEHMIREAGAPELVVGWFHELGPALELARRLSECGASPRFFHVLGSEQAAGREDLRPGFEALSGIEYRQVALGFVRKGPDSRWLNHDEISAGVLAAVEADRPDWVVGNLGAGGPRS